MVDSLGRCPLHLACAAGKGWHGGLQKLFEANPDALSMVDKSGLLPFQIAAFKFAINSKECENTKGHPLSSNNTFSWDEEIAAQKHDIEVAAEIDILYNLLRADPGIKIRPMD